MCGDGLGADEAVADDPPPLRPTLRRRRRRRRHPRRRPPPPSSQDPARGGARRVGGGHGAIMTRGGGDGTLIRGRWRRRWDGGLRHCRDRHGGSKQHEYTSRVLVTIYASCLELPCHRRYDVVAVTQFLIPSTCPPSWYPKFPNTLVDKLTSACSPRISTDSGGNLIAFCFRNRCPELEGFASGRSSSPADKCEEDEPPVATWPAQRRRSGHCWTAVRISRRALSMGPGLGGTPADTRGGQTQGRQGQYARRCGGLGGVMAMLRRATPRAQGGEVVGPSVTRGAIPSTSLGSAPLEPVMTLSTSPPALAC